MHCLQQLSIKEIMIGTTISGISDRLWHIYSTFRCCWNVTRYKSKIHNKKIELLSLFCRNVSYLTDHHCQFQGVGQGIKRTRLCLWYPLLQAQWDRWKSTNSPSVEFDLFKRHHLYSWTWNQRIGCFLSFSVEGPVWSLPRTNKGTSRREGEHS